MKTKKMNERLVLRKESISSLGKKEYGRKTGTDCWTAASFGGLGITCLFTLINSCTC